MAVTQKKLNIELPHNPKISHFGIYSKELQVKT